MKARKKIKVRLKSDSDEQPAVGNTHVPPLPPNNLQRFRPPQNLQNLPPNIPNLPPPQNIPQSLPPPNMPNLPPPQNLQNMSAQQALPPPLPALSPRGAMRPLPPPRPPFPIAPPRPLHVAIPSARRVVSMPRVRPPASNTRFPPPFFHSPKGMEMNGAGMPYPGDPAFDHNNTDFEPNQLASSSFPPPPLPPPDFPMLNPVCTSQAGSSFPGLPPQPPHEPLTRPAPPLLDVFNHNNHMATPPPLPLLSVPHHPPPFLPLLGVPPKPEQPIPPPAEEVWPPPKWSARSLNSDQVVFGELVGYLATEGTWPTRMCFTCGCPIAIFGWLTPCRHLYCLSCADFMKKANKCGRCSAVVNRVESMDFDEDAAAFITECSVPQCAQAFFDQASLQQHYSTSHPRLARPPALPSTASAADNRGTGSKEASPASTSSSSSPSTSSSSSTTSTTSSVSSITASISVPPSPSSTPPSRQDDVAKDTRKRTWEEGSPVDQTPPLPSSSHVPQVGRQDIEMRIPYMRTPVIASSR